MQNSGKKNQLKINIYPNPEKIPVAILISGRGSNMQALVEAAKNPEFPAEIVLVLSNNPEAAGLVFARQNNINCQVVNHRDFADIPKLLETRTNSSFGISGDPTNVGTPTVWREKNILNPRQAFENELNYTIKNSGAQLICLAGFMRILSEWFVKQWERKIINIHPSLLPAFKGADAVGDALKAGVKVTGCTTHFVSNQVDSGEIIMQKAVSIRRNDNKENLARRILFAEHKIYKATLQLVCKAILKEKILKISVPKNLKQS